MQKRTLLVRANPYAAIDHEGYPTGAFPSDPDHVPTKQHHVGASVDREKTKLGQHADALANIAIAEDQTRSRPQTTRWKFQDEPVELPVTQHYLFGIRHGDLIPCDEKTSRLSSQPKFREPFLVLAEKRADAIERWAAEHPEDPIPFFATDEGLKSGVDPWPELAEVSEKIIEARAAAREVALLEREKGKKDFADAEMKRLANRVNPRSVALEAMLKEQAATAPPAPTIAPTTTSIAQTDDKKTGPKG